MTGGFLLPRPVARRPAPRRSAARGIWGTPAGLRPAGDPATGVPSRGTPGRAFQGGQPVVSQMEGRVEIPIHLQPAGPTAKHPPRERERGSHPATARAPLRGWEAPRRHNETGPIPGALTLPHPPEGSPPPIPDGPGKAPVPPQAPYVQVLHHPNRLGFRQLRGDLVEKVPADVLDPTMQPGQAQGRLLVVAREDRPLSLLPRLRIPIYYRPLLLAGERLRTPLQKPQGPRQGLWGFDSRAVRENREGFQAPIDAHPILRPLDLPGLGVRALHLTGQGHKPAIRLPGDRGREDVGLPGLNERDEVRDY